LLPLHDRFLVGITTSLWVGVARDWRTSWGLVWSSLQTS